MKSYGSKSLITAMGTDVDATKQTLPNPQNFCDPNAARAAEIAWSSIGKVFEANPESSQGQSCTMGDAY
jgi:hypothetical protein